MPRFRVKAPDGRSFVVDAPEGATQDEVLSRVQAHAASGPAATTKNTIAGLAGNYLDAMIPGASGAVRGAREALVNAVQAPFSADVDFHPLQSYHEGQAFQEARQKAANAAHPTAAALIQGGGILSGALLPAAKITKGATLGAKIAAGAKTAGAYGVLSGALSSKSDGILGTVSDAVSSGALSAAMGASLPIAAKGAGYVGTIAKPITAPIARMAGKGLEDLGGVLPGAAGAFLANEGRHLSRDPVRAAANAELDRVIRSAVHPVTGAPMRPSDIAPEIARRQALGVPAVPADLDEGMARRLGAAARGPGPALTSVRARIDQRQAASGSRMSQHVREALGPTANIDQQAEAIRQSAQAAARPHYEEAYAAPGAADQTISEIVGNRSNAMQAAIGHAHELALREGRDPTALGFDLTAQGEPILNRVPSFETLDLVKRGLEGVADKTRDAFGSLTNDGRTIMGMARPLVARMREVNPAYGKALDAYGGAISGREALMAGRDSLREGADDLTNATEGMTPYQRQNFALGNRSAMANDLSDFGRRSPLADAGTRARQNFGLPGTDTYQALQGIHGTDNVDRLATVSGLEDDAHGTWKAVRGSAVSPADLSKDDKQISDAAKGAVQAALGHPGAALGTMAKALSSGNWKQGAINERIAGALSEAHFPAIQSALRDVGREKARRTVVDRNGALAIQSAGRFLGGILGTNMIAPGPDDTGF